LDIRHLYIRPRTPHLNGKVERSHRIDDQEFYQLLDKDGITDDIHLFNEKLREWEDYYNYHRPHGALDGQTPYERLVAKMRERERHRRPRNLQFAHVTGMDLCRMARPAGLEPATSWFVAVSGAIGAISDGATPSNSNGLLSHIPTAFERYRMTSFQTVRGTVCGTFPRAARVPDPASEARDSTRDRTLTGM